MQSVPFTNECVTSHHKAPMQSARKTNTFIPMRAVHSTFTHSVAGIQEKFVLCSAI